MKKSYLELKIVANNLQEIERLIKWSEYLGFKYCGITQENDGVYWAYMHIDNNYIQDAVITIDGKMLTKNINNL